MRMHKGGWRKTNHLNTTARPNAADIGLGRAVRRISLHRPPFLPADLGRPGRRRNRYSLRSASTGSLRLADDAGMRPAMNVRNTLMSTSTTAACQGSCATFGTSNSA